MVLRQSLGRHGQECSPLLGIDFLRFLETDSQLEKSDNTLHHNNPCDDPSDLVMGVILI